VTAAKRRLLIAATLLLPAFVAGRLDVLADEITANRTPVPQKLLLSFLADNSTFTMLDARSAEEFQASHISGAINVPHDSPIDSNTDLPADLDEPIVVYCRTGKRATALQLRLQEHGYTGVQVLQADQVVWFDGAAVFNCGVPSPQESTDVLASNRAAESGEETK
jgi:rhodanese-related sulfurtransferase